MRHRQPTSFGQRLLSACLLAAGCGCAGLSLAEEPPAPAIESLRVSGFGTVGVTRTSAPPSWGFQRESMQPNNEGGTRIDTDSRLGLQANYAIGPRFELVGQLLLTRRIADSQPSDAVAWAFAAFRPTDNLTIRAGRVNVNLYQLSDYRSVGLAYPFVRPPAEFYNLLPSDLDGLDVTQSWRDGGDATWKLSGYYGQTKQANNRTSSFRTIRPLYGAFISREDQGVTLRASYTRGKAVDDLIGAQQLTAALQQLTALPVAEVANEAAALRRGFLSGQSVDFVGLSLNLDRDDWLLMIEASRGRVRRVVNLDAGYVMFGHRFGTLTPYAALTAVRTRAVGNSPQWLAALTPVLGPAGAAQAQGLGDAAYRASSVGPTQRTLSLGMRWDTSARTALKFQYDRSRINTRGSLLWANGTDAPAAAHVLSATFDFVF